MKFIKQSLAIGSVGTLGSFALSYAASSLGFGGAAHLLYWQGWWLQGFLACSNVGSPERPLCEGTPLNLVVFMLGLPFGIVLYTLVALVILVACKRGDA